MSLVLPAPLLAVVVGHAQADAPVEACGALVGYGTRRARRVQQLVNVAGSAHRFEIDPTALLALCRGLDVTGERVVAWYHSHTSTDAVPSPADVAYADPSVLHLIVSTVQTPPVVRCWRIVGGWVDPVAVLVLS